MSGDTVPGLTWGDAGGRATAMVARPLQAMMAAPTLLYLGTLTVMLFRPPDLEFFCLDRIAFGLLVFVVGLRAMVLRRGWRPPGRILWPIAGLVILVLSDLLSQPFEVRTWSVAAAKFFVPYGMFYIAGLVFCTAEARRKLEVYTLAVLGYLIFLGLASLAHLDALIFPRFILDPSLGVNILRARGPFLQAVANGTALNSLGLIALDAYGRGKLKGPLAAILIGGLPLAILATMTRSVWLAFLLSIGVLLFWTSHQRVRRVCWAFLVAGAIGLIAVAGGRSLDAASERFMDRETVDFRLAAYAAGWTMIEERPVLGWGAGQTELAARIQGFQAMDGVVVHNSYFEMLLDYGALGSGLYLWLVIGLLGLGRSVTARVKNEGDRNGFLAGRGGRKLWLLLLGVYFVNATFVVMNYQFVNGFLFTIAGTLAYQDQRQVPLEAR